MKHLDKKIIQEPRNRYCNSDDRADIAIFDVCNGDSYELDIAMAHPWCPDVLTKAANENGAAALRAENRKNLKYSKEILPRGHHTHCIPLVFEHFGHWGWEAQKFFANISKSSVDEEGKSNANEFKSFWRRRFSVTLQRCNSQVISRKLARSNEAKDSSRLTYYNQICR